MHKHRYTCSPHVLRMSRALSCHLTLFSPCLLHTAASTAQVQLTSRDGQCRNKTPPKLERKTLRDVRACSFQTLQAPRKQAYQGMGAATHRIYPAGVNRCWVALVMGGQQHMVMPVHRRWQTALVKERAGVQGKRLNKEGVISTSGKQIPALPQMKSFSK